MTASSRVLVLTRAQCTLCKEAEIVVAAICEEAGISWRAVDVDSDEDLKAAYTEHVPVVFTDGELHGYWFVDAQKLKQALAGSPACPMGDDWRPVQQDA